MAYVRLRLVQQLREADQRKDDFLATLAHELRNPLGPLRNAIEVLRRAEDDSVARPIQDIMERQVSHLVRLVDDLMELSRITRGTFELRREPLELQTVIRNAVETAKARLEGPEAVVTVTDTGEGIDPTLFPRLFDMFTQGNRTSSRSHGGLGIGLALARRLVEMHGGNVHAESAGIGEGSRFTVRLPLGKASHETKGVPQSARHIVPQRVLVVDDNEDAATSLGMLLNFLGADVRVEHDGPAALSAFDAYRPGIVLLDIGMPVMDGYEVARTLRMRADGARVPLVAVTGWGQEEDRRRAKDAGFDYHLVKPADIEALQALLASLAVR
jgi:CheY-like chemotaxis protein